MRLEDNFYNNVNQNWLDTCKVPADLPALSTFHELYLQIEKEGLNQAQIWLEQPDLVKDQPQLLNFSKLLKLARTESKRTCNDLNKLQTLLDSFNKYTNWHDIVADFVNYKNLEFPFPIVYSSSSDMKSARKKMLYFGPNATILPDSSYYAENHPQAKQLLDSYRTCTLNYLKKLNWQAAEADIERTIKFDASFARFTKSNEAKSDYVDDYHPLSLKDYIAKLPAMLQDLGTIIAKQYAISVETKVSDAEPNFTANLAMFMTDDNFVNFKSWAKVNIALSASNYLNDELRILGGAFSRAMMGVKEARSFEKYTFSIAQSYFGDAFGLAYAKKHISPAAKANILDMLKNMINVYKERLQANSWLSASTKEMAIKKLEHLALHIAYPDKLSPLYDELTVNIDANEPSLLATAMDLNRQIRAYKIKHFNEPIDPELWSMTADTVNAYYSPSENCIVFPAAILQPPFYDLNATPASNYGGIGAVMAHEISHAFDNNGSQFDEEGNLCNWWQESDYANFKLKTNEMIQLFDKRETPVGPCNGKLTVSENIADAGGISCAYTACLKDDKAHEADFYVNWARIWRMKGSDEYFKLLLSIDCHAPNLLRANVQLMNLASFQTFYKLNPNDKMYLSKEQQVTIW